MNSNRKLPDELIRSARTLQARFEALKVPSRKVSESEWDWLPSEVREIIPQWLPVLLQDFSLLGGVLSFTDRYVENYCFFSFWDPVTFARAHRQERFTDLLECGLFPFAEDSYGSVWLTRSPEDAAGPIYLLLREEWTSECPSEDNGLVFAASRLSLLLASMAVSEKSYGVHPTSVFGYADT
jgi:hypothetical protein